MKTQAINELIKMVKTSTYVGLEMEIQQSDLLQVVITGVVIIPHVVIEKITEICTKYNLLYYYRVSLECDKPEIMIFEEDEPF